MITFAVKQNFFYRHKQLQVQVMFFKIQTIEQIPGFRTPVTWNELKYTRGLPRSMIQGSSEVPKHATKPSKRLVERIQPYISTAFFPTSSLYSWWAFFSFCCPQPGEQEVIQCPWQVWRFFSFVFFPPFPCQLSFSAWQDMLGSTSATLKEKIRAGLSGETEVVTSTREASSPGF